MSSRHIRINIRDRSSTSTKRDERPCITLLNTIDRMTETDDEDKRESEELDNSKKNQYSVEKDEEDYEQIKIIVTLKCNNKQRKNN